jgi:hypothetical protein
MFEPTLSILVFRHLGIVLKVNHPVNNPLLEEKFIDQLQRKEKDSVEEQVDSRDDKNVRKVGILCNDDLPDNAKVYRLDDKDEDQNKITQVYLYPLLKIVSGFEVVGIVVDYIPQIGPSMASPDIDAVCVLNIVVEKLILLFLPNHQKNSVTEA